MSESSGYADRYGRVLAGQCVRNADRKGAIASIMGFGIVGVLTTAIAVCSVLLFADAASAADLAFASPAPGISVLMAATTVMASLAVIAMRLSLRRAARVRAKTRR